MESRAASKRETKPIHGLFYTHSSFILCRLVVIFLFWRNHYYYYCAPDVLFSEHVNGEFRRLHENIVVFFFFFGWPLCASAARTMQRKTEKKIRNEGEAEGKKKKRPRCKKERHKLAANYKNRHVNFLVSSEFHFHWLQWSTGHRPTDVLTCVRRGTNERNKIKTSDVIVVRTQDSLAHMRHSHTCELSTVHVRRKALHIRHAQMHWGYRKAFSCR